MSNSGSTSLALIQSGHISAFTRVYKCVTVVSTIVENTTSNSFFFKKVFGILT